MRFSVEWQGDSPKAEEVAGSVSAQVKMALQAESIDQRGYKAQALVFEAATLSGSGYSEPLGGVPAAANIQRVLREKHGVRATRRVNGWDLGGIACQLERRVNHRQQAMQAAIDALRQTRSWFKDKRLAEIRVALENALREEVK